MKLRSVNIGDFEVVVQTPKVRELWLEMDDLGQVQGAVVEDPEQPKLRWSWPPFVAGPTSTCWTPPFRGYWVDFGPVSVSLTWEEDADAERCGILSAGGGCDPKPCYLPSGHGGIHRWTR